MDVYLSKSEMAAFISEIQMANRLPIITVYTNVPDHQDPFVARVFAVGGTPSLQPTHAMLKGDTLKAVRDLLPEGMALLPRDANDNPTVVESWI